MTVVWLQQYRPGPWCDLLDLSGVFSSGSVRGLGCRPTGSSMMRPSTRPSARPPGPLMLMLPAVARRPAASSRTRSADRTGSRGSSITADLRDHKLTDGFG